MQSTTTPRACWGKASQTACQGSCSTSRLMTTRTWSRTLRNGSTLRALANARGSETAYAKLKTTRNSLTWSARRMLSLKSRCRSGAVSAA
jgi:hypothetical protein